MVDQILLRSLSFLLGIFCILGSAPVSAQQLGGRPFSDPAIVVPMPKAWIERGIRHETPEPVDLVLAIDQQIHPALVPLVQAFARENNARIAMQEGTCGLATGAAADKTADIAGYCCPPGDLDRLPGLRYHTLGIGALALITHPDNPLDDIGLDEARAAFGGQARSWADLPVSGIKAAAGDVRAVGRLHCKIRPTGWQMILPDENQFSYDLVPVQDIADMIGTVATTRGSLGYETLYHVGRHPQHKVKVLRLNGIDPADADALAAGRYPLYRVFSISSWADAPAAKPLADRLARYLVANAARMDPSFGIVPNERLRAAGWRFKDDELVGEPPR